jgi:hypothetical protein
MTPVMHSIIIQSIAKTYPLLRPIHCIVLTPDTFGTVLKFNNQNVIRIFTVFTIVVMD